MDFGSFWTVWFWICHVATWSVLSHFALGVPFDMILEVNREKSEDGPWARATEALILAQVFRYTALGRRYGVVLTGVTAFLVTVLLTFSVMEQMELARALATILLPMTVIYATSLQTAFRIERRGLRGADLRGAVRFQRLVNQLIGLLAIMAAVALAIWEQVRLMQPWWF
ncbi:hypothetical protein HMH01_09825 [Halovulum dunhuangense]|uniref:Component of SufBCD complex n=1 Tax=Halovulum dunhuangense TaxID=1505036 RepID=A0A849L3E1_9RHOB|nr:hypothetical protein [Halovulum dunhuangense]NNU80734.1 hypothetical protein [Halovulum dunhuangense]